MAKLEDKAVLVVFDVDFFEDCMGLKDGPSRWYIYIRLFIAPLYPPNFTSCHIGQILIATVKNWSHIG